VLTAAVSRAQSTWQTSLVDCCLQTRDHHRPLGPPMDYLRLSPSFSNELTKQILLWQVCT